MSRGFSIWREWVSATGFSEAMSRAYNQIRWKSNMIKSTNLPPAQINCSRMTCQWLAVLHQLSEMTTLLPGIIYHRRETQECLRLLIYSCQVVGSRRSTSCASVRKLSKRVRLTIHTSVCYLTLSRHWWNLLSQPIEEIFRPHNLSICLLCIRQEVV